MTGNDKLKKPLHFSFYIKVFAVLLSIIIAGEIACRNKYYNQNDRDLFYFLTPFFKTAQTHKLEHGLFVPSSLAEKYGIDQSDYPDWLNTNYDRPCRDRMGYSECLNERLPISFNQFCWRGNEIEIDKKPEEYRILVVGGSATESMNIVDEDLFTKLLENHLNDEISDGKTYQVINAGHTAYDSRKINQMLDVKGFVFQPDVVLYTEAFNEQVGALEFFKIQQDMLRLGDKPYIGWVHRLLYLRSFLYTYAVEKIFFSFRDESEFEMNPDNAGQMFRKTITDCRQNGSQLVYLTQPIDYPLVDENGNDLTGIDNVEKKLKEIKANTETIIDASEHQNDINALNQRLAQAVQLDICREMGVPVIDVRQRFHSETSRGNTVFQDIVHRTCAGERVLADEIFSQREAIIPVTQ